MWLGEHAQEVDFDYFARQIYNHTDKYPRGGMGHYTREQVPESVLREIYQWMVVHIGMRASVGAAIKMGERMGRKTTFNVTVTNRAVEDVGLDVEGGHIVHQCAFRHGDGERDRYWLHGCPAARHASFRAATAVGPARA